MSRAADAPCAQEPHQGLGHTNAQCRAQRKYVEINQQPALKPALKPESQRNPSYTMKQFESMLNRDAAGGPSAMMLTFSDDDAGSSAAHAAGMPTDEEVDEHLLVAAARARKAAAKAQRMSAPKRVYTLVSRVPDAIHPCDSLDHDMAIGPERARVGCAGACVVDGCRAAAAAFGRSEQRRAGAARGSMLQLRSDRQRSQRHVLSAHRAFLGRQVTWQLHNVLRSLRLFTLGLALLCLSEWVQLLRAQPEAHFLNAADTFRPKILKLEVVATREP
jgi:hypothetical protein